MDRRQLSQTLLELLEDETGEHYTDLQDDVELRAGLELDSVDMVSLILQIENRLQIKVDTSELEGIETVGQLLDLLQSKLGGPESQAA